MNLLLGIHPPGNPDGFADALYLHEASYATDKNLAVWVPIVLVKRRKVATYGSPVHLFTESEEYVAFSYGACLRMSGTFDATEWNSK